MHSMRAEPRILIIGAGFSGLCLAIRLRQAGIEDFLVLEAAESLGGTWRDNTYPGCACDIPSHLYSFSFAPNPDWSRRYPAQAEIRAYLERCADHFGVRGKIRFGAEVVRAAFDEDAARWQVRLGSGETLDAQVLVAASGPLSKPALPDLPGLDRFRGPRFHSARWDHGVSLRGLRVGVVGTGASAIQFVPHLAEVASGLVVFQRTPPWVVPRGDRPFGRLSRRALAFVPLLRRAYRSFLYWRAESLALGFLGRTQLLRRAERWAGDHLARSVPDPVLREKLTPDYALGCKRVLISDDYYPALQRPNVSLETSRIAEVLPQGIRTEDGAVHELDALILGTGFRATDFLAPMEVVGRGGALLGELWRGRAESYLGISVPGFPNFFTIIGPNTGLGHNSMVFMIESAVSYILRCIQRIRDEGLATLEVRARVERAHGEWLRQKMSRTVWVSGCRSWYLAEDGSNPTLWPDFTFSYWWKTRRPEPRDFLAT